MPSTELELMTAASDPTGAELLYLLQGGADRKVTVDQLNASRQPLDPTLSALSGLNPTPGFVYQTSEDSFIKTDLTPAHMAALRTFVRPISVATNLGGGFFQSSLFRFTLADPDGVAAQLILCVRIVDATKSGSLYIESPVNGLRFGATMASSIPGALLRSNYAGAGTSIGFSQLAASGAAPNIDLTFLVSPTGFTSPSVAMSAVLVCPGDAAVSIL